MIRIVVADHHVQTLAALKMMLQEQQDMVLVGESGNGEELLELAASCEANVILVDRTLPGFALAELLTRLHALPSSPFVIVMGSLSEHGRSALRAGADAFVSKSDDPRWLLECIPGYSSGTKK